MKSRMKIWTLTWTYWKRPMKRKKRRPLQIPRRKEMKEAEEAEEEELEETLLEHLLHGNVTRQRDRGKLVR